MLAPTITGLGYECWGVEYLPQGKYSVLRIYIDKDDGVTLDDLGEMSQQLNRVLDVEDPIHGVYNLEVSSPGIDRQLFFPEQCERYIGKTLHIKVYDAVDKRRKFNGVLQAVNDNEIHLLCDEQDVVLSWDNIDKAKLVSESDHGKGK